MQESLAHDNGGDSDQFTDINLSHLLGLSLEDLTHTLTNFLHEKTLSQEWLRAARLSRFLRLLIMKL